MRITRSSVSKYEEDKRVFTPVEAEGAERDEGYVVLHISDVTDPDSPAGIDTSDSPADLAESAIMQHNEMMTAVYVAEWQRRIMEGSPLPGGRCPRKTLNKWYADARSEGDDGVITEADLKPFGPGGLFTAEEEEALLASDIGISIAAIVIYRGGEDLAVSALPEVEDEEVGWVMKRMGFNGHSLRVSREVVHGRGSVTYKGDTAKEADRIAAPYESGEEWYPEAKTTAVVVKWKGGYDKIFSHLFRGMEVLHGSRYVICSAGEGDYRVGEAMDRDRMDFFGRVARIVNIDGVVNMWTRLHRDDTCAYGMLSFSATRRIPVLPDGARLIYDTTHDDDVAVASLVLHRRRLDETSLARLLRSYEENVIYNSLFKQKEGRARVGGEMDIISNCTNSSAHTDLAAYLLACRDRGTYGFAAVSINKWASWDGILDDAIHTRCAGPICSEYEDIWVESYLVSANHLQKAYQSYGHRKVEAEEPLDKMCKLVLYCFLIR